MAGLSLWPMAYRHVVFPEASDGSGRVLNLAPESAERALPAHEPELTRDEHACVRWLFRRAGLDLDDYRPETIKRRIPACLRVLRVESSGQICAALQRQPHLLKEAVSALVIGVTSFFRDAPVFALLSGTILPELLARSAGPRIWSVGCSDGSELYSVAMLLAERGGLQRSSLLGTDCRPDAVARAREGCFDPAAVKNVPPEFLGRYLRFDSMAWRVHPYLRTVTQWRSGNVLTTAEPGAWDLILCRNLAIYMQPAGVVRLWRQIEQCLRPGGIVVLGKAERPHGTRKLAAIAPGIYRRERN